MLYFHPKVTPPQRVNNEASPQVTGPWTATEHKRFLMALDMFPQGPWKAIAKYVGTRTPRQTQTHAQKYREKLFREMRGLKKGGKNKPTRSTTPTNINEMVQEELSMLQSELQTIKRDDDFCPLEAVMAMDDTTLLTEYVPLPEEEETFYNDLLEIIELLWQRHEYMN